MCQLSHELGVSGASVVAIEPDLHPGRVILNGLLAHKQERKAEVICFCQSSAFLSFGENVM